MVRNRTIQPMADSRSGVEQCDQIAQGFGILCSERIDSFHEAIKSNRPDSIHHDFSRLRGTGDLVAMHPLRMQGTGEVL